MKSPCVSSESTIRDLATWCTLASDVLNAGLYGAETDRVRHAKRQLLQLHARHLDELRALSSEHDDGAAIHQRPIRPHAWAEVIAAMKAADEYVALAACALLERAVLAAYERSQQRLWDNANAVRVILRHKQEISQSCHELLRRSGGINQNAMPRFPASVTAELPRALAT